MPLEGPGRRFSTTFTKAATHGAPVVEVNHAGIAAKSTQAAPMVPSLANAAIAQQIAAGEEAVIMMDGLHEVPVSALYSSPAVGDQVFIRPADNTLHKAGATQAGDVKFGVIDSIDTGHGRAQINLTQRSSF